MNGGARRREFRRLRASPLVRNIGSLYAIQLAGYILPLISFPYLVRVLGPSQFGVYVFVLAVARFGLLLTDWGFNYTATRHVATARARGDSVSPIYSSVMLGRVVLLTACAALLAILTLRVGRFERDAELFWIAFAGVAGSALLPIWLFQAWERLVLVTSALLAARVVTTALIFVIVQSSQDLAAALLLWSLPWVVAAVVAAFMAPRLLGVRLMRVSRWAVVREIRGGTSVFLTLLFSSVYTILNAIVLGLLSTNAEVGYFGAAEVVIIAAVGLIGPLAQALFPRAATAGAGGEQEALAHVRRIAPAIATLGVALTTGILVIAPLAAGIFLGNDFDKSIHILQIMSPIPLTVALATILATQLMLPLNMDRAYSCIVGAGAAMSIVLTIILVPSLAAKGTAISVTTTEIVILLALYTYVRRRGLDPLRRAPLASD